MPNLFLVFLFWVLTDLVVVVRLGLWSDFLVSLIIFIVLTVGGFALI